jgi:CHAT domain-containing protein
MRLRSAAILGSALAGVCLLGGCASHYQSDPLATPEARKLNLPAEQAFKGGKFADAIRTATDVLRDREKTLGPDHPDVVISLDYLAGLYRSEADYVDAEPLDKRVLAIREKALGPDHPFVAWSVGNLAIDYEFQGRYAEAEPLERRSLAVEEKLLGSDNARIAIYLHNLGDFYRKWGRFAEAEPLLQRSLAIREKAYGPKDTAVGESLKFLADLYVDEGRYREAEPLYQRAIVIEEKKDYFYAGATVQALAVLYYKQGRYAESEQFLLHAVKDEENFSGENNPRVAYVLHDLLALYIWQHQFAKAQPILARTLAIRENTLGPDNPLVAQSLNDISSNYIFDNRPADALPYSRRAIEVLSRRFARPAELGASGIGAEQRSDLDIFLSNISLVFQSRDATAAAESFEVAQLSHSSSSARAVAGMAARFAAGNDALAAAVRERQDLVDTWQRLDTEIVAAEGAQAPQRDAAADAKLRDDLAATRQQIDKLDATIGAQFPAYSELSNPKPVAIDATQALLANNEAMLVYLTGPHETWLWALRHDRAALYRLNIGANALADEVTALRSRLDPERNPALAPFDARRAYVLYQRILAPALPVLAGAHLVFIVPDGALESLPFGVLVTQSPSKSPVRPEDHRAIKWFAQDYALAVLPSVGSLKALREFTSAGRAASPFAGIGDPVLEGPPGPARGVKIADLFRGAVADVDAVRQLPPLPETADELRAVAKLMGAGEQDLYLSQRADEQLLRHSRLDRYRVIEFATHGLMSGDLQGLAEPALVLTPPPVASPEDDGLLTASKVATLKLNADWIILSACNTAASDGTPDAGGLSALAKAFFYAGARSILVSHWAVVSDATVPLTTGAFRAIAHDPRIGPAEAMRQSMQALLSSRDHPKWAHPLFWAPFSLIGEGAAAKESGAGTKIPTSKSSWLPSSNGSLNLFLDSLIWDKPS